MANWSKRRSWKSGNSGQRTTRTTSTSGKATYSNSKRIGNTRTTYSTNSDGKVKVTTTEHHPVLGTRRTTKTLNQTTKVKKSKSRKSKAYKPSRKKYKYTGTYAGSSSDSKFLKYVGYSILAIVLFSIFKFWLLIPILLWLTPKWWRYVDNLKEEIEEDQKSVDNFTKTD